MLCTSGNHEFPGRGVRALLEDPGVEPGADEWS